MTCRVTEFPGGMSVACTRGSDVPRCQSVECYRPSVALCDWPLAGAKAGATCDRRLCAGCRTVVGPQRDYCRAHAQAAAEGLAAPRAIIGARSFRACHLVRELVLELPTSMRVVSGHAAGTDIVAELVAHQRHLATSIHAIRRPANAFVRPSAFGMLANGRNTLIADEALEADAFVNAECRGTWDTIQKLRGLGKVVRIHDEPPPDEQALVLFTAPHPRTKQASKGYTGPCQLDVTRGSGGPAGDPFAPSSTLLTEAKGRMRSDPAAAFAWYAPRYRAEMLASWRRQRPAWDALLARNVVVLCCYCKDRTQCHRGLLAGLLVKAGVHVGRRVVDAGEVVT